MIFFLVSLARAGVWLFKGLFAHFFLMASVSLAGSHAEDEPEFDWLLENKRAARAACT